MIKRVPMKRKFTPIKRVSDRQKVKNEEDKERTGELHRWFQKLWNKLPFYKFCSICGAAIWGENKPIYWDHLIPKADRWDIAFEEWNIVLCCSDCHNRRENGFPLEKHKELINKAIEYDKQRGNSENITTG